MELKETLAQEGNPVEPEAHPATFGRGKRVAFSFNVFLMVAIALAIVVLVNFLSTRRTLSRRFDVTSVGAFSLSDKTRSILESLSELERPVEVFAFLDPRGLDPHYYPVLVHVDTILREYESAARPGLRYENVELGDFRKTQSLAEALGLNRYNVVVFRHGERVKTVEVRDVAIFGPEDASLGRRAPPRVEGFKSESLFTSAIVEITEGEPLKAYFTVGHGETSIRTDPAARDETISWFAQYLEKDNYALSEVNILEQGGIPGDCAVVIVAMPQRPFEEVEARELVRFLQNGGRLLWLDRHSGFRGELAPPPPEALLDLARLTVDKRIVSQEPNPLLQSSYGDEAYYFLEIFDFPVHPITQPLIEQRSVVFASKARYVESGAPEKGVEVKPILVSSPKAWSETFGRTEVGFQPKTDTQRQFTLGVAATISNDGGPASNGGEASREEGRFVLITGLVTFDGYGNPDFLLNCVNWLAGKTHLIGIDPKQLEERTLRLENVTGLRDVALYLIPGAFVVLGVFVWWLRRS